ncbi:MAG: aspartate aminotransferase family protein [Deltaproteobacteria bacterium]|jgi:glutamate/tyrosine decarboxylase-like PLP-dependent enzyme|nr:aspartate aminotransferase family protein [Deltaproteobacteria bacterium]
MPVEKNQTKPVDPFKPYTGRFQVHDRIPEKGRDKADILKELSSMAVEENQRWQDGRVSGTFYHAGEDHLAFLNQVFSRFSHMNTIQFDLCPSMFKMESEIISMTAKMLHGDAVRAVNPQDTVCGTLTSGGTESILMAMKVYRDRAKTEKGIQNPEIVMPHTAHPAFDKAGEYFGIRMVHVPVSEPDFRVDPGLAAERINENTVAIVGSAGNYPYGLIDPLDALSELALEHDIGFHVDGCLGGFLLPWLERLGYPVPPFDFRLPGVTSMSADTHKYGFALKGTSVVLYRNNRLRRYQYFNLPDWPGGLYASPTSAGSRSGGLTAATWASMVYLGEAGYLEAAGAIMDVADEMKAGIEKIPELSLIGDPTFVISFRSDVADVYHVNDFMKTRGWRFNCLQLPPALHFCITMPQASVPNVARKWVEDLQEGVAYAKEKQGTPAETSAIYGLAGTKEGNQQVTEMVMGVFDHLYSI